MANKKSNNAISRGMPNNIDAEAALLCSILIDKNAADMLIPELREDDFYLEKHRIIFSAMKAIQDSSMPIDTSILADRLVLMNKLDEVGSIMYLTELAETVPSAANAEYYLKIVKRDSLLRKVIETGVEIANKGYTATDGEEALNFAESKVFHISEDMSATALYKADRAAAEAMAEIEDVQHGNIQRSYINTGIKTLDNITRGLKPGELILLAARPSVGKTAFALNIAAHAALNQEKKVAIFSLEMPSALLMKRVLSHVANVSLSKMSKPRGLSTLEYEKLYEAYEKLLAAEIYIDDYSMNSPTDVLSKCRRLKREKGLDLVIIDYLQLMSLSGVKNVDSRQQEVAEMSRRMKLYASELKVPIIVLSQLSRAVELREDKIPQLSDLRESGSIEQDADVVLMMYRPANKDSKGNPIEVPPDLVILKVAKNRNGEVRDKIELTWRGETTTFAEREQTNQNAPYIEAPISHEEEGEMKEIKDNELPFGDEKKNRTPHSGLVKAPVQGIDDSGTEYIVSNNEAGDQTKSAVPVSNGGKSSEV
ncbi:MAG: replicative DNA helicase [Clostridiales bacterium]|nr:replicative DNA helicase [Clostridiales bacterium]